MLFSKRLHKNLETMTNKELVNFIQAKPRSQRTPIALSILTQRSQMLKKSLELNVNDAIAELKQEIRGLTNATQDATADDLNHTYKKRHGLLNERLKFLIEQYKAVSEQYMSTVDKSQKFVLKRQLDRLEKEISEVEAVIYQRAKNNQ